MAKKKGNNNATVNIPVADVNIKNKETAIPQTKPRLAVKYMHAIYALAIGLVTFLVFRVCLDNQFVSWDDPGYITENKLITNLSAAGISQIFSKAVMGNYHPLTMLSLAIEYSYVQLHPWLYHFDSVMLHIIATVLVYWLVALVTGKPMAGVITALLFGLHPMHVESVAWVSARKDVLYGSFYLAAMIAYVHFVRKHGGTRWVMYVFTLLFFACALLSKPVAVVLPLSLLLVDYLEKRKTGISLWLEKIPFFLLAIGLGLKSIHDQRELGVVSRLNDHFSIIDTLTMGCYTLGTYLWKAVLPLGLSCFYPYPLKTGNLFPIQYYLYPFAIAAILFVLWRFGRGNRNVVFGFLFFLVNIVLLLQFLPVGNAIIAERYSYMSYLGLFFIAGAGVATFLESGKEHMKKPLVAVVLTVCLAFGLVSNARCKVWHDSTTLWADQKEKHPDNEYAYNSLGVEYFERWKKAASAEEEKLCYDSAQYYLNKAVEINPNYVYPYLSLGVMARVMGRVDEAKGCFLKAAILANGAERPKAYLGLGILYFITRNVDSSAYYLRAAIRLKPDLQSAHANYANLLDMTGKKEEAMKEYDLSVSLAPGSFESYLNRGRLLLERKRNTEAFRDFNKAIELNPQSGEAYYTRALYYGQAGEKALALHDLEMAVTYGYKQIDKAFYDSISQ